MARRNLFIVVLFLISVSFILTGCGEKQTEHLKAEQQALIAKNTELLQTNQQLKEENKALINSQKKLSKQMGGMHHEIEELKRRHEFWMEENKQYVVVIKVKEFHYSIDPNQYIKDEKNAITIPIQVSKTFFDAVKEGDKLNDRLRIGSVMFAGNFGDRSITIKEKKVVENIKMK